MKVLLILVDGMRPDALTDVPGAQRMIAKSTHCLDAQTVFPSVTLPCHVSLFHSVDPSRHGTTTNIYAPQVRPVRGLFEVLKRAKKKSAMFYSWDQLRDVCRPGMLAYSEFISGGFENWYHATQTLTEHAIDYIKNYDPDFTFLYHATPDEMGHAYGWMSGEYLHAVRTSWELIDRVVESLPEDYVVMVMADHGGHDRTHGTDLVEDMTIPVMLLGGPFAAGKTLENVSIKDIAPTVAALLGAEAEPEWEGKVLFG